MPIRVPTLERAELIFLGTVSDTLCGPVKAARDLVASLVDHHVRHLDNLEILRRDAHELAQSVHVPRRARWDGGNGILKPGSGR